MLKGIAKKGSRNVSNNYANPNSNSVDNKLSGVASSTTKVKYTRDAPASRGILHAHKWAMWYQEQVKARVELHDAFNDLPLSARFLLPFIYIISVIHSIFTAAAESIRNIFAWITSKTSEPPSFTDLKSIPSKGGTIEDINQEYYNEDINQEDYNEDYTNQEDMIGGMRFTRTRKAAKAVYNTGLFSIMYIPAILTLAIVIFLIIFLVWRTIQTVIAWITFDYLLLPDIPISFSRPTTQLVYSIFFVITSIFLIFFLLFARGTKMKTELDIIQIGKELLQSVYIIWPLSVLLIGSAIAKAFYKMACGRDKTNLLNFAKLVESSVILALAILVLIKVVLLIRPFRCTAGKIPGISTMIDELSDMVSRVMNFGIIYAALRVITLFIEDIVSDKLVFFIAKMSKNVESPPVECNEEANVDETQSKAGNTMETIYMYVIGAIVWIILIVILVIQLPHPWMGACRNINNAIGRVLLNLGYWLTVIIGAESYKKACEDRVPATSLTNKLPQQSNMPDVTGKISNMASVTGKISNMANQITEARNEEVNANMDKNKILLGLKSPPPPPPPPPSDQEVQERIKANMTSTLTNEAHDDYVTTRTKEKMRREAQAEAQAQQRRNDYDKDERIQIQDRERGAAEDAARAEGKRALLAEQQAQAQAQAQANKSSDQKPPGKTGTVNLEPLPNGSQPLGIERSNPFGTRQPLLPIPTGRGKAPSPTAPTSTPAVVDTRTKAQLKEHNSLSA
jgi:hypothetical protein